MIDLRFSPRCGLFLLLVLFNAPGPVARALETVDRIVAIADEEVVMQSELERQTDRITQQLRQQGAQLPSTDVLQKQVLDRLIITKLQLQLARRSGINVDDDTLNNAINSIAAKNNLTLTKFREVLEKESYDFNRFREDIRDEITVARLKQREVDNRVSVTDREVENFLSNRKNQAAGGNGDTEYHLAHILIAIPDGASPEQIDQAKAKAEKVLADLRGGADFAKTAIAYSNGQQALEGGDLGWRKLEQVPTLFAGVVPQLKAGEFSGLIRNPGGFHIIRITDIRTGEKHIVTQTHARHILIRTSELLSREEALRKLDQLRQRIVGGDDFAELARSHSDDRGSAANGGDLGWTSPGEMVPEFEAAMRKLQPNEISEPFETQFGFHIVQVLARREHDDTEEARRTQARETIRQRKIEEETTAWMRRLRDEAYVEYRLEASVPTPDADDSANRAYAGDHRKPATE